MRIGFSGKGGSGKTTLAGLFTRFMIAQGGPVLALDCDMNQHLGAALGLVPDQRDSLPTLGGHFEALQKALHGQHACVQDVHLLTASTPPARGSVLAHIEPEDPIMQKWALRQDNLFFAATGEFEDQHVGSTCYHTYTGGAELLLSHLLDTPTDTVVADLTAGSDPYTSGMFRHFDVMVVVAEPTVKSLDVLRQCAACAAAYGVPLVTVGNKVLDAEDDRFIREAAGSTYVGAFTQSRFVRQQDRGHFQSLNALEAENQATLDALSNILKSTPRDWSRYQSLNTLFHQKAAEGWANAFYGLDLMTQIDPSFDYQEVA